MCSSEPLTDLRISSTLSIHKDQGTARWLGEKNSIQFVPFVLFLHPNDLYIPDQKKKVVNRSNGTIILLTL